MFSPKANCFHIVLNKRQRWRKAWFIIRGRITEKGRHGKLSTSNQYPIFLVINPNEHPALNVLTDVLSWCFIYSPHFHSRIILVAVIILLIRPGLAHRNRHRWKAKQVQASRNREPEILSSFFPANKQWQVVTASNCQHCDFCHLHHNLFLSNTWSEQR